MSSVLPWVVWFILLGWLLFTGARWVRQGRAELAARRAAQTWPKAGAVIDAGEIKRTRRRMRRAGHVGSISLDTYEPVLTYSYQVGGQTYQSLAYRNTSISRRTNWTTMIPKNADAVLNEYPAGRQVHAVYNPQDPGQAYLVLDTSERGSATQQIGGFALAAAALLALLFSLYRAVVLFVL